MSRTHYYRTATKQQAKDAVDVEALCAVHVEHPFYGVARLAIHLGWSEAKTRQIVGWRLGSSHSAELTFAAVLNALSKHEPPAILHSDQGSEYLSYQHQELCAKLEIQLSASGRGKPWQNGFMERWFGGFKAEIGDITKLKDISELHEKIALRIYYYNHQRIHTALRMSPAA